MLRGVGDPIDVHEIDPALMRMAIEQLHRLAPTPVAPDRPRSKRAGATCPSNP
jgi:hypothetical protein